MQTTLAESVTDVTKHLNSIIKNKNHDKAKTITEAFQQVSQRFLYSNRGDSNATADEMSSVLNARFPDKVQTDGNLFGVCLDNGTFTVKTEDHYQTLSYAGVPFITCVMSAEQAANIISTFDAWLPQLDSQFEEKSLRQQKREKSKTSSAQTAQALLSDALTKAGYAYAIECRDSRAIVKVKAGPTRAIILNILYKKMYDGEIDMLLEGIKTLQGVIEKFGRYTFICNSKGIKFENDGDNAQDAEQDTSTDDLPM